MNLPRVSRQASAFSFRSPFLSLPSCALSPGFVRITALLLILMSVVLVSDSFAQGTRTITGTLRKNGVPAPNYTFFWERDANGFSGKAVTTNGSGQYSVTFENCTVGWPNQYYYARFALEGGGLNPRPFPNHWGDALCYSLNIDLIIPSGAMDGSRYNAGPTSCPTQSVGGPVNVTNGNMWLVQTDHVLAGSVGGINITRTYNSGINVSGIFGNGWSSEYESRLLTLPSLGSTGNQAVIQLDSGTGLVVNFLHTGGGNYDSPRSGLEGRIVAPVAPNTEYTLTWKDGSKLQFSQTGRLLWKKDRNGNQTSFTYTANDLTGITDPFGRSVAITPTGNGKVSQITDSIGSVATYGYDPSGEYLTSVTYPDGSKYQFEYLTVGTRTYLATVKDALNNVLETHQYDSSGRATTSEVDGGVELYSIDYSHVNYAAPYTTVTDGLGRVTRYYFDGSKGRNAITKIEGGCGCAGGSETTQYEYDSRLNITKVTDALLNETTYTYDNSGNRLTQTDVLGIQRWTYNSLGQVLTYKDRVDESTPDNTVANTYDSPTGGNLVTTTDRLGYPTILTYTPIGQLETITDARNKTTSLTYDTQGRLTGITDANNKDTTFGYDARARVTSTMNAKGETTNIEYDLNNRLKKVIFPDANYVEHTYDVAGRRIATRDPRGNSTTYGYDGAYRLTSITDPLTHARTFGYDLMSNLTSQSDALGNNTNFEYDDFNRLNKVIYPPTTVGATRLEVNTTYDKLGNVKTRVDTAGRATSYDYDTSNRLTRITDALTNQTQFEYNLRFQLTKVKDALNQEYVFTYDPLGRKLSETRAGTTMSYLYDAVGNRTKRTDHNGRVTDYAYDNLNRLLTKTYQGTVDSTFTYDDLSRILAATNSNGTVSFTYDNRGRVDTTTDVYGKVIDNDYDAAGNRTLIRLDGLAYSSHTYDSANRLTYRTGGGAPQVYFSYDNADRLIRKYFRQPDVTTTYSYDGMSRLKQIWSRRSGTYVELNYSYNTANQISQIVEPGRTRTFSYDDLDRITAATDTLNGNESYAYDAVGNRTSSHLSASYTYGLFNRLTATQGASYAYDNNGAMTSRTDASGTMNFSHDLDGRMLASYTNVLDQNEYRYDALGRRVYTKQPSQTPTQYTFDGDNLLLANSGGNLSSYQNGPGIDNKLTANIAGVGTRVFLGDHLGTTYGTTNSSGSFTAGSRPDSFGNPPGDFTGREYDSFSSLYYYRARMYDPQLGRFTSEDPIGFSGGDVNRYAYVWNNPLNHTDPFGLDGWGNDWADYFDAKIDFARQFWKPQEEGDPDWITNGVNNSVADVAHGTVDMLRCGSGIGQAFSNDENGYGIAAFVAMDVSRCAGLFATLASPFAPRTSGRTLPDEPKLYCNSRPSYAKDQIDEVWEAAKDADGRVFDPDSGVELFWDKSKPRNGQWDMGHLDDMPYRKYHRDYMKKKISLDKFKKIHRNPKNYRPESVKSNRRKNGRG